MSRKLTTTDTAAGWFARHLDNPPQIKVRRGADDWQVWLRIDAGHAFADDAEDAARELRDQIRELLAHAKAPRP